MNALPPKFTTRDLKQALVRARKAGVYFVKCGPFVKIGCSNRLNERLRCIDLSVPFETQVLAVLDVPNEDARQREAELHRRFAHLRHRGEWFRFENDLQVFIASLKEAQ
jgi:hypothetical protein